MLNILIWSLALLPGLIAVAVVAGRAAARGQRPWLPLTGIWLAVALGQYFAVLKRPAHPVAPALVLLAPLGVAALVVELEVQRGCSVRRAASVAVLLGVAVAVVTPFLLGYVSRVVACVATGTCI
jgi:hypothetical protein